MKGKGKGADGPGLRAPGEEGRLSPRQVPGGTRPCCPSEPLCSSRSGYDGHSDLHVGISSSQGEQRLRALRPCPLQEPPLPFWVFQLGISRDGAIGNGLTLQHSSRANAFPCMD